MKVPIPIGIIELQMSICDNNTPDEIPHLAHFGLFDENSTPLCIGYVTSNQEWVPDPMKTGYAQAMAQMRQEFERRERSQQPNGVPPGAQAIEVSPEMSQKIIDMIRNNGPTPSESKSDDPDLHIGQYL